MEIEMKKSKPLSGRAIDAMTPAEKQKLIDELDCSTPRRRRAESRPLSPRLAARIDRVVRRMGRPKLGAGTRAVSVTVESDLLERADAYAAAAGIKRSELFSRGLRSVLG